MDGWLYGILRTGPYRGHLLVGEQRYANAGGPISVVSPAGEVILTTDDRELSISKWLEQKGWLL